MDEQEDIVDAELVKRNMAAFAATFPPLFEKLVNHQPLSKLVQDESGAYDIEFRGSRLYDGDGRKIAKDYAEKLRTGNESRLRQSPPSTKHVDRSVSDFLVRLLDTSIADEVTFLFDPPDQHCYHLIVYGLGLGYHLAELAEMTEATSICIVEPNFDFLYHSLSVIEWEPILKRNERWRLAVTISEADEAPMMAHVARHHCRLNNPTGLDWTLIGFSYPNESMQRAYSLLLADAQMIQSGLGFFFDELEMTRASYFNLVRDKGYRLIKRGGLVRPALPAFIIGSGPSIDEDMDFIRDNQDKAVIFSCGSALGVLLSNGIKPDFEVILENGEPPYKMLQSMAETYEFGDLILLASNTVNPGMAALFKESVYFIRPALSSYGMFIIDIDNSIDDPSPTVTNTGLAAALQLQFADVYLFGTDLGSRRPERHHSTHSPYKMEGRKAEYSKKDELEYAFKLNQVALANFGGLVYTDYVLAWARDSMEEFLSIPHMGQRVFNCSDGVRIKGAIAQTSGAIKLPDAGVDKHAVVRELMDRFPAGETIDYPKHWETSDWQGRVRALAEKVIAECDSKPERMVDFVEPVLRLMVPDIDRPARFEEFFLRGTVLMGLIAIDYYNHRVHPPEKREQIRNRSYELFADMVRKQLATSDYFFTHIDEFTTAASLKDWFATYEPPGELPAEAPAA